MAVLVSARANEKDSSLTEDLMASVRLVRSSGARNGKKARKGKKGRKNQSGSRSNGRVSDACLETLLNYECICIMADCNCDKDNEEEP